MASVQQPSLSTTRASVRDETRFIDAQIRRTRHSLKMVDLAAGAITLVVGLMAYLLLAAILDHWVVPGGLTGGMRAVLFGVLAVGGGYYCWRTFVPLLKPINPVYAAHTIEQGSGSLKNSLLNLLLLRDQSRRLSQRVYQAIEQQAAQRLAHSSAEAAVDRSTVLRAGYLLVAILAICALYAVISPKDLATSAGRVLAPWSDTPAPSRVQIAEVQPGEHSVARGERIAISAMVLGAREGEDVLLRYSSLDGQRKNESATMRATDDGSRYKLQFPPPTDRSGAVGVQQDLVYWIECGDGRSKKFQLSVYDRPTIIVQRIRYEFPSYTGLQSMTSENAGDIRAIEGTTVTVQALANYPISSAAVDFDSNGSSDLRMQVDGDKAVASFKLQLRQDRRTPEHASYMLRLATEDGRQNRDPAKYVIDVTPDYAPEVRVVAPTEPEVKVHVDETLPISVEARDPDFALSRVELAARTGDRELEIDPLSTDQVAQRFTAALPFTPRDYELRPGDVVEYWAQAADNRRPEANVAFSERRRLRIIGRPQQGQDPRQRQQDQQSGNGDNQEQQSGEGSDGEGGVPGGGEGQQSEESSNESSEGGQGQSGDGQEGEDQSTPGEGGQGGQQGDQQQQQDQNSNEGDASGQAQSNQQPSDDSSSDQEASESEDAASNGQSAANPSRDESTSQPSKVSPDGDDDAAAFERIKQHLEQQEAGDSQEPQDSAPNNDAQQPQDAQLDPAGGESAEGEPSENSQGGPNQQSGENPIGSQQEKNASDPNQGGTPAGDSAASPDVGGEPQPSDAQDPAGDDPRRGEEQGAPKGDSNERDQGDPSQPGPENRADGSQGDDGAGSRSGSEDQGTPETPPDRPREKTPNGQSEKLPEGTEPPSPSDSKRESDSEGGQQGDQSGGGGRGGGQASDEQGRGASGESDEADQGAGAASQQGDGATGQNAGQDQQAGRQTGQPGDNQPGDGSQSGDAEGGQSDDRSTGATNTDQSTANNGSPGGSDQSGKPQGADSGNGAEPRNSSDPTQSAPDQQDSPQREGGADGGAQSSPSGGGNAGHGTASASASEVAPGDDPNLKFAQEQTELVLNRISDQLAKDNVDQEMLDKLRWNKQELQRFLGRWRNLKSQAERPGDAGEAARQELSDALKSLGWSRERQQRFQVDGRADKLRDLRTGVDRPPPLEYRDSVRAYTRGASAAGANRDD